MSINRKWPIARAETFDEGLVAWIAEARAGTGTWVIREADETSDRTPNTVIRQPVVGMMVDFDDEQPGVFLPLTREQREELGMSDEVWHELEVRLRTDCEKREHAARDARITELEARESRVIELEMQVADLQHKLIRASNIRETESPHQGVHMKCGHCEGEWELARPERHSMDCPAKPLGNRSHTEKT